MQQRGLGLLQALHHHLGQLHAVLYGHQPGSVHTCARTHTHTHTHIYEDIYRHTTDPISQTQELLAPFWRGGLKFAGDLFGTQPEAPAGGEGNSSSIKMPRGPP